jgi:hypothetical protein
LRWLLELPRPRCTRCDVQGPVRSL